MGVKRRGRVGDKRWLALGLVVAVALVVVLTVVGRSLAGRGGERSAPSGVQGRVGDLPDFPIIVYQGQELLGGEEVLLSRVLGGKPLVVNYWASRCPPCEAEMPGLERVWQRYKDKVLFLGLDVGRFFPGFGSATESKKLLGRLGITYPAGTPTSLEVVQALGVEALPSTVFVTPQGKVYRKWLGIITEDALQGMVEQLLSAS